MNWISGHLIGIFISLGGIGLALGLLLKGVKPAVHWIMQRLLNDPKYRPILLQYRQQIEKAFDDIDNAIAEELDMANKEDEEKK